MNGKVATAGFVMFVVGGVGLLGVAAYCFIVFAWPAMTFIESVIAVFIGLLCVGFLMVTWNMEPCRVPKPQPPPTKE